jgi:hypothetical protein
MALISQISRYLAATGVCQPTQPQLQGATFLPDGRTLSVPLNTLPRPLDSTPCSAIFDTTTASMLGADATCSTKGALLQVKMTAKASVMPGDPLMLQPQQTALVSQLSGTAFTGGLPSGQAVASCLASCKPPVATVSFSPTVSEPCNAASAATSSGALLDASRSVDLSGRPLVEARWAIVVGQAAPSALTSLLDATNSGPLR